MNSWKSVNIHPIPKRGDPYRSIVLTYLFKLVFETLLINHIISHLDSFQILQDTQYGFRKQRSTTDLLIQLSKRFHQSVEHYDKSFELALDISKAFNHVWHSGLLSKLPSDGLLVFCPLLTSLLSNIIKCFYFRDIRH